ncbi:peptidase T [Collinsella sp. zg1085]|uniref:peptidase T n=1 Tax=Collinsella sp. zg1085 TaxID=2844380 RepID=UPI001C0D5E3E|nr:peptidase T [Collinsella sp. zg1085]QWT17704.1 peptidase T [Collinsella sp. zg1085]
MSNSSDVLKRFLRYVQVFTTSSDEHSYQVPSTACQFDLAHMLTDELRSLGAEQVEVSEHAYVTAHIPASPGAEHLPRLGLIAHIDTTEQALGEGVKPHIVHYTGGDLVCGEVNGVPVALSDDTLPELHKLVGKDLVCTDGTTLLGADDKAGVAEIMSLVARLSQHPELPHPPLGICFCPDEEIGHGAELLDIERFACDYAYTVDGGPIGVLEWECFNAAEATVSFEGRSIHTGDAKGRMIHALNMFTDFHALLPPAQRAETTEGYEGFIHLEGVSGTASHATARYIIRDHSADAFAAKIDLINRAAEFINAGSDTKRVHVEIKQQYRNMAEVVSVRPELISRAEEAFRAIDIEPRVLPIRGGTDGAQLSFRGLPCPNISTGGYCMHGVHEFIPVESLEKMVDMLVELVKRFSEV